MQYLPRTSNDRRLARRTAAPLAAVALPAEIGVVDLDPSRQALCGVPLHHRLHELVLDLPGGGLGDAKPAAQLNAGDAALALSEVVHGAKPSAQRYLGRRENRSGDHRCRSNPASSSVPSTEKYSLDNNALTLSCTSTAAKICGATSPSNTAPLMRSSNLVAFVQALLGDYLNLRNSRAKRLVNRLSEHRF